MRLARLSVTIPWPLPHPYVTLVARHREAAKSALKGTNSTSQIGAKTYGPFQETNLIGHFELSFLCGLSKDFHSCPTSQQLQLTLHGLPDVPTMAFATDRARWEALTLRNPAAHTSFLYGVKTTNVFCRPTCPARLARRANVVFFDTIADAESAGFRACKRCKPDTSHSTIAEQHSKLVTRACCIIEQHQGHIAPKDVAKQVGLSPRYFHGIFKQATGTTPARFAKYCSQFKADSRVPSPHTPTIAPADMAAVTDFTHHQLCPDTSTSAPLDTNCVTFSQADGDGVCVGLQQLTFEMDEHDTQYPELDIGTWIESEVLASLDVMLDSSQIGTDWV